MLGRAMQYINFIRDIAEDNGLGRRYLPLLDTPLEALSEKEAKKNPEAFSAFIRREIERYQGWQKEAAKGYSYIPRRYRIPIMTATDMYCWTASQIAKDPFIVFESQVKPPKFRILRKGVAHLLGVALSCSI
ncbi:phytoene/squalene synthase family protein [Sphaerochaeta halotolerans]|uniref:phytoene/squalene synthase family protein n=1 Tax=Sphaerochaeta halotolerans TaxID=2293840 RepID=UPI0023E853AE|nr:squalene/phytoene synthase family protein [Sphaerochaeta halotolerans]